jgi:hypothetical protein
MGTINGITCSKLSGHPRPQQERIEQFEIPGIDGVGLHLFGKGDGMWQAELVYYDTGANVDLWYQLVVASVGQIVSVTNDWNTTASDVLVLQVGPMQKTVAIGEGGARGACLVALQSMS